MARNTDGRGGSERTKKIEQAAFELRRQGASFAIICHTLGLPYRRAMVLGRAYDEHVGHPPAEPKRRASQISLPGYTVRDGTRPGKGTTPKTSDRGKARISSQNQVTLPVAALATARLKAGDPLWVQVEGDGKILLVRDHDPLLDFIGAIPGLSAATDLERLRDEWDQ